MPLQNRVTPFSTIEAVPERGLFMGNRGCLHNEQRELVTDGWRVKRWLICELSFQGRHRTVMQPRQYTELFFLDEAVALAAGHRPCALCRRTAFDAFIAAWASNTGQPAHASLMDTLLHQERLAALRRNVRWQAQLDTLPDGTLLTLPHDQQTAWLKYQGALHAWSHAGYTHTGYRPGTLHVRVLTPPTTVEVLRAGYTPCLHPSVVS